ncbi:hypothetical protein VTN00DRAFT_6558 [Thermoascus crustaceus]|uniref:uncharacterized protein n=1 Tax=Thermoascus crustaceus TaxID=5088 RepID=UPI0037426976
MDTGGHGPRPLWRPSFAPLAGSTARVVTGAVERRTWFNVQRRVRRGRISTSTMGKKQQTGPDEMLWLAAARGFDDEDEDFLGRVRSDGSRPIPGTEAQNDERVD